MRGGGNQLHTRGPPAKPGELAALPVKKQPVTSKNFALLKHSCITKVLLQCDLCSKGQHLQHDLHLKVQHNYHDVVHLKC